MIMMRNAVKLLVCSFIVMSFNPVNAQGILKKIKQKAGQATDRIVDKKIDKTIDEKTGTNAGSNTPGGPATGGSSKNNPSNKGGAGLVVTPPNVSQNLTDSEAAFKANNLGEARYALQQAMLGVEMEIGKKILAGLPETVSGLKFVKEDDQVTSTGWGWVGLTIQRTYNQGDKQLNTTIANNAMWMSALNLYLANGGYSQTSGDNQNWKLTKLKGHKAIIEFNDNSGYKLSVPIGQSSLIVWEGVNFATEQEIMDAANSFDIESIKKILGEK